MPVPQWVAQINKRVFNKLELKRGKRPVLTHIGRSSGKSYQTPLDAHRTDNSFIFLLMYGSGSDWVKNVMASGSAGLRIENEGWELINPRLISMEEARRQLPETNLRPGRIKGIEYLQMDITA